MPGPSDASKPRRRLSGLAPEALMAQGLGAQPANEGIVELPGIAIETPLGRGGMGTVYLGKQVSLDREVAVKVLAAELADDPLFLERLEREARTMARLRHPNIVAVHDFQKLDEGGAAIVMEFIAGGSLREMLRQHPHGLPLNEALRIIRQIAAGLEAAHASGIIHRDMKPENVLIDRDGMARVTDFGLALPLHESNARLTLTGTTVGTVEYMAPEQLKGGELDARLDIFALGVIAYELLTGQTPRGSFDAPRQLRVEIPAQVSAAVMRALRPNPAERFATIEAFVLALHSRVPEARAGTFKRALATAAVVLALAALAGGIWASMDRAPGQGTAAAKVVQPQLGAWRDAIAGVHIHNDNYGGDWKNEDGVLTSNDAICVMAIEKDVPPSYDARMRFTRLSGEHSVTLFFRAPNGTIGSAELDAWSEALSGVQVIQNETLQAGYGFRYPLENGRSYELLVEVRPNLVRMSVDGVFQKEFDITAKVLHPPIPWNWDPFTRPAALAVGSYESPTRFEKVEWREVKDP
ncbi:MAG: serine/threonine-protein kinase [Prosthecobacter sp.]